MRSQKYLLLVSAVLLVAGAGCTMFTKNNAPMQATQPFRAANPDAPEPTTGGMKGEVTVTPIATGPMDREPSGRYEDYESSKLALAKTGKVVLFFKAGWCSECREVDMDITKKLHEIPADVSILKVNFDTATELRKKYAVTYQHTFVQVDSEGSQITKWSGSPTLADILGHLK